MTLETFNKLTKILPKDTEIRFMHNGGNATTSIRGINVTEIDNGKFILFLN